MASPSATASALPAFREAFHYVHKDVTHWFPGHMAKGFRRMQQLANRTDCIVEVHDARLPFSGRNDKFRLFQQVPHILVFNKADLVPKSVVGQLSRHFRSAGKEVHFLSSSDGHDQGITRVFPSIINSVDEKVFQRQEPQIKIMIAGMPNVGKSSFLNAMRRKFSGKGKASRTGAEPGVTRAVQTHVLVCQDPPIYVIDTPGVMIPDLDDPDVALKLALVGTMRDDLVGVELIADYLLFTLNKHKQFSYVERFALGEPSDNIELVLEGIAKRIGALGHEGRPFIADAAQHFVNRFREGTLGHFCLDDLRRLDKRPVD